VAAIVRALRESPKKVEEEPERTQRAPRRYGRGSGGRTEALVARILGG